VPHPALITADHLELVNDRFGSSTVAGLFGYGRGVGLPSEVDVAEVRVLMQRSGATDMAPPRGHDGISR